jgi:uncharacterized protein (TIGR02147 family)
MKTVFDFNDYRNFLKDRLPVEGPSRGARNRLAEALNCQKGFVSQVLSGRSHFSLEHGMRISRFLELDAAEEEYFLLLLHLGRAGSKDLEKFYEKKLGEIHERRKEIKERIRARSDLSEAEQMIYYSSWHYTAIHMCLFLPGIRSRTTIAEYLGLSPKTVARVLEFLLSVGLAKENEERGEIAAGPARIHISQASPFISRHHTNWRMKAIDSLDAPKESDLHYSLIMSIDENAAEKVRELILKAIQDIEPVLKAAEDKAVYTLNVDLFGLKK